MLPRFLFTTWNSRSDPATFTARSTSAFKTLNTTTLAAMASANVTIAVIAKSGDFRTCRAAWRMSRAMPSSTTAVSAALASSMNELRRPKRSRASRRASSGAIPAAILSSILS